MCVENGEGVAIKNVRADWQIPAFAIYPFTHAEHCPVKALQAGEGAQLGSHDSASAKHTNNNILKTLETICK